MNNNWNKYKSMVIVGAIISVAGLFFPHSEDSFGIVRYSISYADIINNFVEEGDALFFLWLPILITITTVILMFTSENAKAADIASVVTALAYVILAIYWFREEEDIGKMMIVPIAGAILMKAGTVNIVSEEETAAEEGEDGIKRSRRKITFVAGEMTGASIPAGEKLIIGKDPQICNILLTNPTCSRMHCEINFDEENDRYIVRDMSTNGTYLKNGERLPKEEDVKVACGTILSLGDGENKIKLC